MINLLYRKKKYFWPGGSLDSLEGTRPNDKLLNPPQVQNEVLENPLYKQPKDFSKLTGAYNKVSENFDSYSGIVKAGVNGALTGANNQDKGKHDTAMNTMKQQEKDAADVLRGYTAGQNVNLLKKSYPANSAKDLKNHKGWKNILGSTASGAMAGATIGGGFNPYGAAIGAVVGLIGSSVGEIFGARKRRKQAEQEAEQQRNTNYAIDYYNNKQFEQLESANDQAAKNTADLNRTKKGL